MPIISHSGFFLPFASVRFCPSLGFNCEYAIFANNDMIDIKFVSLEVVKNAVSIKHQLTQFLSDRSFTIQA